MLERRPDRLIALTAAAFFACLPLQWQILRWSNADIQRAIHRSDSSPWWATGSTRALDRPIGDRTFQQHVVIARLILHGAGSLIPLAAAIMTLATRRRSWLIGFASIYIALGVALIVCDQAVRIAASLQNGSVEFSGGMVAYVVQSLLGLLSLPLFLVLIAAAYRRIDAARPSDQDGGESSAFGLDAVHATSCLSLGIGLMSLLLGSCLPRQEFRRFVHPESVTDLLWAGIVAIGSGAIIIRLALKVRRFPATVVRVVGRVLAVSAVAFVGVYGLHYLYDVLQSGGALRINFSMRSAGVTTVWLGCLGASFVLWWYWRPVAQGQAGIDWADIERKCPRCGYDLTGNASGVCSECGAETRRVARSSSSTTDADAANPY